MKKLTARQQKFVVNYIECGNASEAARRAGYSEKTAFRSGQENMQKPAIKAYINEQMEKLQKDSIASADEVLQYLTSVMRGEQYEEENIIGKSGVYKATKQVTPKDRLKAADLLAKRYGLQQPEEGLNTNLRVSVVYGVPEHGDNDG
jgi:phage terminase small subunit